MVVVISRFRVANGMEAAVASAFGDRPRLVDLEPGFLGMETFTDAADPAVFHLVTRWTDAASYETWHKSERHRHSHVGIPKGLKVEAAFTEVLVLDRLPAPAGKRLLEERAFDAAPLLASFLEESTVVCVLHGDREGLVTGVNRALTDALGTHPEELLGKPVWPFLPPSDQQILRERLDAASRSPRERFTLNFAPIGAMPVSLTCQLDLQPGRFVLLGEPAAGNAQSGQQLVQLNNELATVARERARESKELARARAELQQVHDELKGSYWHLRKIQEVLPICMECGKVKVGEAKWDSVVDYLKKNSLFLSHGYCPDCAEKALLALEQDANAT